MDPGMTSLDIPGFFLSQMQLHYSEYPIYCMYERGMCIYSESPYNKIRKFWLKFFHFFNKKLYEKIFYAILGADRLKWPVFHANTGMEALSW